MSDESVPPAADAESTAGGHDSIAPTLPVLGPADDHRGAAEKAAGARDFDTALRERFRAVIRGLEQYGLLEVRRSRTAHETAVDATTLDRTVIGDPWELSDAADNFDEVVYGGRSATEAQYRRLEHLDRYSLAPPPVPEPTETTAPERRSRSLRDALRLGAAPRWLRDPRFWVALLVILALALIGYLLTHLSTAPPAPPSAPHIPPPSSGGDDRPPSDFGPGSDSLFARLPHWLAFGGLQCAVAALIVVCWRARRRGTLVGEPRPVEVPAGELLAGQAAWYRRIRDRDHVAALLRAATLRRIRPALGLTATAPPDRVIAAVGARTGADPGLLGAALFGAVPDDDTLLRVVADLDRIESDIG